MRFVMRILGVAAARCAKLKLRCLIYSRQEDEACARADGKLIATCKLCAGRLSGKSENCGNENGIRKNACPAGARRHPQKRDCVSPLAQKRVGREKARIR
ncbi:unnamed protein product [Lasius platythorax]|uniref:Uncharacterized protein n=1 Tax=Lasius platythorax TaxID=488582 RepID=A0AAV2NKH7_9HYME